jgi:hypothetical protein
MYMVNDVALHCIMLYVQSAINHFSREHVSSTSWVAVCSDLLHSQQLLL